MKKIESVFLQDLALIDWSLILQNGTDLNEQVSNWCEMLSMIIEKHAPLKGPGQHQCFAALACYQYITLQSASLQSLVGIAVS